MALRRRQCIYQHLRGWRGGCKEGSGSEFGTQHAAEKKGGKKKYGGGGVRGYCGNGERGCGEVAAVVVAVVVKKELVVAT